jgi:hypothetical protein
MKNLAKAGVVSESSVIVTSGRKKGSLVCKWRTAMSSVALTCFLVLFVKLCEGFLKLVFLVFVFVVLVKPGAGFGGSVGAVLRARGGAGSR